LNSLEIGDVPPVSFDDLFPELTALLEGLPGDHLTVVITEDGCHLATSANPEDQDTIVRLLMTVTGWALESWTATLGDKTTEQLFAIFITSMADRMGWRRDDRRKRLN
jgi:hypothetical protein